MYVFGPLQLKRGTGYILDAFSLHFVTRLSCTTLLLSLKFTSLSLLGNSLP
jgi:hypothetical protein